MSEVALLFPGQGSQELGMGRDIAEKESEVMDLWKQAERASGVALREIYWDGDAQAMAETRYLQPALTAANLGLWIVLSKKCAPMAAAGHSLGEYSALAAAGVLPMATVLDLVSLRGKLMSEADPSGQGAMAAVLRLSTDAVRQCLEATELQDGEILVVANYNTPTQTVISGSKAAIEKAQAVIKAQKGRALPLAVSGAFHSPLLRDAAEEFRSALRAVSQTAWNDARFPVYSNATATAATSWQTLQERLAGQMTSSVHWVQTIANQFDAGARTFVECGPKNVLSRMVEPILKEHAQEGDADCSTYNVNDSETLANFAG